METTAGHIRLCVMIPTYNNAGTIRQVVEDVSKYCDQILVVAALTRQRRFSVPWRLQYILWHTTRTRAKDMRSSLVSGKL